MAVLVDRLISRPAKVGSVVLGHRDVFGIRTFMNRESVIEFLPQAAPPKAWPDVEESVVGLPDAVGGDMSGTMSGATPLLGRDVAPSRPESTNDPCPPRHLSAVGGGGFTRMEPDVSPPREARATDASKLNFPLPLTITAVVFAVSIGGAVWTISSDVRDISTRIDGQVEAARIQRDLDKERLERAAEKAQASTDALKTTVDTIQKEQRLMQIEFQNFRESVLNMQGRR